MNGRRAVGFVGLVALVAELVGGVGATAAPRPDCRGKHWVAAWAAAPSDAAVGLTPGPDVPLMLARQTFRTVVVPHSAGRTVRVHLTNRFGNKPLRVDRATIARAGVGPALATAAVPIRFRGERGVTVPAGSDVTSDPLRLRVRPFERVAVSVSVPGDASLPTEHFAASRTSYLTSPTAGDHTSDTAGDAFAQRTTSAYLVDGLDVLAPAVKGSVAAFGDSITDGWISAGPLPLPESSAAVDADHSYPDFLQRRVGAARLPLSIVDSGISGNRILRDGLVPPFGPAGVDRVERDVAGLAGVRTAIILEGINDITQPPYPGADEVIRGLSTMVTILHRHGVRVLLGTITPASNALQGGTLTAPQSEAAREAVNGWIRRQVVADGFVDFAAAVADPADPTLLRPEYAGPGNLHPNAAGYEAMANAVDLDQLRAGCSEEGR